MGARYLKLLRDPRWQKKRLETLQRDSWSCRDCGRTDLNLQVHHVSYLQGKMPWEYPDSLLRTLCELCHEEVSLVVRSIDEADGSGPEEWSVWFRAPKGMLEEGANNGAYAWGEPDRSKPNARVSRNCLPIDDALQADRDQLIRAARLSLFVNLGTEQSQWKTR